MCHISDTYILSCFLQWDWATTTPMISCNSSLRAVVVVVVSFRFVLPVVVVAVVFAVVAPGL